jgi:hypothetical protein
MAQLEHASLWHTFASVSDRSERCQTALQLAKKLDDAAVFASHSIVDRCGGAGEGTSEGVSEALGDSAFVTLQQAAAAAASPTDPGTWLDGMNATQKEYFHGAFARVTLAEGR